MLTFKQFTESSIPYVHQPSGVTYYYKDKYIPHGAHTDKDNILHRDDGPAIISPAGSEYWYQNDQLHRIGEPAVTLPGGGKQWWERNKLHREEGPAVILANNGGFQWWINGKQITEKEFNERLKRKEIKAEIQGHQNNRIDPGMLEDYL